MKIGKWQWDYYRYRKEVTKGVLSRFNSVTQQRRALRMRLKSLSRDPSHCEVTWLSYAIAYIALCDAHDRLSYQLEKQAKNLLLNVGILPPKSTLSGLFVDLFTARLVHCPISDTYRRYQLLANYCKPTFHIERVSLSEAIPLSPPIRHRPSTGLRQIRRMRLSSQFAEAEYLCRACSNSGVTGERILIEAQRAGGLSAPTKKQCSQLLSLIHI